MRTIIAVIDDLFFASKLRGTGEQLGAQVIFVKSISDAVQKARDQGARLIIADLNARCCNVMELAQVLKNDDTVRGIPLFGFFSHVEIELQEAALAAGFDRVLARSAFTKNLPEILSGNDS